jgi:hypothetical protein
MRRIAAMSTPAPSTDRPAAAMFTSTSSTDRPDR